MALPLAFTLLLTLMGWLPNIHRNQTLAWSFWGAAIALLAWAALLWTNARRQGRVLGLEVVLRPQHYVQAFAHLSILP